MSENDQIEPAEKLKKLKKLEELNKLRLHPTAALVILWSLPLYSTGPPPVREFLEMLDLSSGEDLVRRCDAICDWYGEVILNRKHFIKSLVEKLLAESENRVGKEMQIVILAAGKSPLALVASHRSLLSNRQDLRGGPGGHRGEDEALFEARSGYRS